MGLRFCAPQKKIVAVISGKIKYSVDERWVKGNQAEIANECVELGRIDDVLHFTPTNLASDKKDVVHHLVLTDKHWEIGSDGVTEKEVGGPLAWRIENPEPLLWITVNTAIRYVKEARERTADPTLKKNADQTLAQLKKLH